MHIRSRKSEDAEDLAHHRMKKAFANLGKRLYSLVYIDRQCIILVMIKGIEISRILRLDKKLEYEYWGMFDRYLV